jgi:hypothetical protein
MATDIDCLVVEDQLLYKDAQPVTAEDRDAYRSQYTLD